MRHHHRVNRNPVCEVAAMKGVGVPHTDGVHWGTTGLEWMVGEGVCSCCPTAQNTKERSTKEPTLLKGILDITLYLHKYTETCDCHLHSVAISLELIEVIYACFSIRVDTAHHALVNRVLVPTL